MFTFYILWWGCPPSFEGLFLVLKGYTLHQHMEYIVTCMSDYRQVLDWWSGLLDLLIQCVTALYNLLLHTHAHAHTIVHSHVFASRCSVAASNGRCSSSSGFSNYPQLQLPVSHGDSSQWLSPSSPHNNWLTHSLTNWLNSTQLNWLTVLLITSQHGPHRKCRSSVAVYGLLPSNVIVWLFVSWSLLSCRSTCHIMFSLFLLTPQQYSTYIYIYIYISMS
jgi:hypothetical protein